MRNFQTGCCNNGSGVQNLNNEFASLQSKVQALENQLKKVQALCPPGKHICMRDFTWHRILSQRNR